MKLLQYTCIPFSTSTAHISSLLYAFVLDAASDNVAEYNQGVFPNMDWFKSWYSSFRESHPSSLDVADISSDILKLCEITPYSLTPDRKSKKVPFSFV